MFNCPCQIDECVLCEAELYLGLSTEQVCQIRGMLDKRAYDPHEYLFREGDPNTHLFVLRTGQVKLTTSLPDGREQIIRLGVAGQLVGFESVDEQCYSHNAQALTPVEACRITHKDVLKVLEQNPTVSLRVIRALNQELEEAQSLIRDLGLKSAAEKVASFLLSLIPSRGPMPEEMPLPLSRQEIAEMLGLTEETVSRIMAEFRRERLIEVPRGRLRIVDQAKLTKLAGIHLPSANENPRASSAY